MITGTILHLIVGGVTTVLGFFLSLVPGVPGWLTGSAPEIQAFFQQASLIEGWIPVIEALTVVKQVMSVWAVAALIFWVRSAYAMVMAAK